ncbi:hypothetical protein SAMN05216199_1256 [Pedococcus cremeus]|uniref:Uncharacterized protein n=1 Tax=Pedococcus cremeus TaxID=587636 RepID=A0A1H9S4H9_9MICO|nr:hypothetical protein [Pedococcus cremeus]SER79907.1 hypothetical protein SAMN05216199_1256 [Pedococcus cremeus]
MTHNPIDGPQIDTDARLLIRSLCTIAGDSEAVRDALLARVDNTTPDALLVLALTALHVTFSECLDAPVPLDRKAAA